MTDVNVNRDGLLIPKQDLSQVSPSSDDDGRLYNHDGSSSITLVSGETTTQDGLYVWSDKNGAWLNPKTKTVDISGNRFYAQSSQPSDPNKGDIWIDTT